jgi:hypothetical protein
MIKEENSPATGRQVQSACTPEQMAAHEVERLIAAGKCKQAVELAKDEHKRRHTAESERLLVDAYLSRIEQFQNKGAVEDSETLLNLVRERFPSHRERLAQLGIRSAAIAGKVDDLVAPLAKAELPMEQRTAIESAIRQQLLDLPGLANCRSLPAEHPLKLAAAAVWRAFGAATAGPVADEQIALLEVSRRSPLAGWKMLVRAIAAFHRNDDDACRQAMEAIPEDAVARRLVPVLTAMIEGKPTGGGMAGALQARVGGDDRPLKEALQSLEDAIQYTDLSALKRSIRQSVQACSISWPELYERLRQHISVRCAMAEVPVEEVLKVLGSALKSAYFWHLYARGMEKCGANIVAAMYWERFLRHAEQERIIEPGSMESATVYLHAAGLLSCSSQEELQAARTKLSGRSVLRSYYEGQPSEIAALAPKTDREVAQKALDPGWLFARAAEIHADAETFKQWWAWVLKARLSDRSKEEVAQLWRQKRPGDPQPLLVLSSLAEERSALKLAMKYLAEAEAIDALNPLVRKARVRLTLATTWRHFNDKKPHLVERDLAELEAMPAMVEGDHGALLRALRAAWHALRQEKAAAQQACDALVARMGPLAAGSVLNCVGKRTGLARSPDWPAIVGTALPDPRAVAEAEARTIRLADDLNLRIERPVIWDRMIHEVLRQSPCPLSYADLLAIGRAALHSDELGPAYLASAAGLATAGGPLVAWFLLLRSQSLPPWADRRASQCLRAAMQLAQQAHDAELLSAVSGAIDEHPRTRRAMAGAGSRGLGEQLLAEILKNEREARTFPRNAREAERHVVTIDSDIPSDEFYDEQEVDDEEESGEDELEVHDASSMPDGFSAALLPLVQKMIERYGRLPLPEQVMKDDPRLALELASLINGVRLDENMLEDLESALDDGPPRGFGARRSKNRRRRH